MNPEPKRKCLKTYLPGTAANRLQLKRELERKSKATDVAEKYVTLSSDKDEYCDILMKRIDATCKYYLKTMTS